VLRGGRRSDRKRVGAILTGLPDGIEAEIGKEHAELLIFQLAIVTSDLEHSSQQVLLLHD